MDSVRLLRFSSCLNLHNDRLEVKVRLRFISVRYVIREFYSTFCGPQSVNLCVKESLSFFYEFM